jgi:hypothetical protein
MIRKGSVLGIGRHFKSNRTTAVIERSTTVGKQQWEQAAQRGC